MIARDFARALGQALDGRFLWVLLKGLGLTVALLVGLWFGAAYAIALLPDWSVDIPFIGPLSFGIGAAGLAWLAILAASAFLMIPVAAIFIGFFLEEIAGAVERRHYPHLAPVRPQPLLETLVDALQFFGLMVAVNLVALVLYLVSGPFAPIVFWLVNGFLLGREYFQMVALRRLPPDQARALRKRHFGQIQLAGTLMALPLTIPVLNLIVPILGVATFTHLFHRLTGTRPT
jgi:CysZ protein